jgi:hypothetical protein
MTQSLRLFEKYVYDQLIEFTDAKRFTPVPLPAFYTSSLSLIFPSCRSSFTMMIVGELFGIQLWRLDAGINESKIGSNARKTYYDATITCTSFT